MYILYTLQVGKDKEDFDFLLPDKLRARWEQKEGKPVDEIIKLARFSNKIAQFRGNRLFFVNKCIEELFDETVRKLVKEIRKRQADVQSKGLAIDALVFVGGFSMSSLVIARLRKTFSNAFPIIRPQNSELAVVMGAVLYGQNESIVESRVMAHTYGVACTMEFDHTMNSRSSMYKADGKEWAANVFHIHVRKGNSVQLNAWTNEKDYRPDNANQKSILVHVFASDKKNPKHTDDGYCVGKFEVDFTHCEPSKRVVMVSMRFGSTEVEVRGRVESTGFVYTQKLGLV